MKKWIRNIVLFVIAVPLLALLYVFIYTSCYHPEIPKDCLDFKPRVENFHSDDSVRVLGKNWARKVNDSLFVCYTEGSPEERGFAYGYLLNDLMAYQEKSLFAQMEETIEGDMYRKMLCRFVRYYNSGIQEFLTEEQRREIYGISLADTHDFDDIAEPFERQLILHAAHDIGHAMQDYMLVGCSSFALNEGVVRDSSLIFGRNFDFYCGDDFSRTKVVSVCRPDSGYAFASVTWGGMLGVVSGMNEKGLSICINASKLDVPKSVAMPISMLVRHILIHCKNIEEAYAEAQKMKTFVAENIVIASKEDNDMAIIEKSPEDIAIYRSESRHALICTNHFQSEKFMNDERNLRNYNETDSKYRYELLEEEAGMLEFSGVEDVMRILLNPYGKNNENIGFGNEMAINQLIAHHSIVLCPDSLDFYVCSDPKSFSPYLKFNLDSLLAGNCRAESFDVCSKMRMSEDYRNFLDYKKIKESLKKESSQENFIAQCDSMIAKNPLFFESYNLAGDMGCSYGDYDYACRCWSKALKCEIPKLGLRKQIEEKIKKYE